MLIIELSLFGNWQISIKINKNLTIYKFYKLYNELNIRNA